LNNSSIEVRAMNIVRKILGPKSKYDKSIPYTYEARVPLIEGKEACNSYLSDTICGLIEYLDKNGIGPDEVEIFEVYLEQESLIEKKLYSTPDNRWILKPDICRSFEEHYEGHIEGGRCSFEDRDRKVYGP
jgi:hypothetical protein